MFAVDNMDIENKNVTFIACNEFINWELQEFNGFHQEAVRS